MADLTQHSTVNIKAGEAMQHIPTGELVQVVKLAPRGQSGETSWIVKRHNGIEMTVPKTALRAADAASRRERHMLRVAALDERRRILGALRQRAPRDLHNPHEVADWIEREVPRPHD